MQATVTMHHVLLSGASVIAFHFHVAPSYGVVQTNAYCIVLLTFTSVSILL